MKKLRQNGMKNANFLSILTYWWMNNFFEYGSKNDLAESDMLELLDSDASEKQCSMLENEWNKEIRTKKEPSLIRAIFKAFKLRIIIGGFMCLAEELLRMGIALMIGFLVQFFANVDDFPMWHAYALAVGVALGSVAISLLHHLVFYQNFRIGWLIRVSLCGLMYKKTLRLSQHAMKITTTGQIVNLSANDVLRFDQLGAFAHYSWVGPLQCILATAILWMQFEVAIIAGIGVLCLTLSVQALCGKAYSKLRLQIAAFTDYRVRCMSEVIAGIRIIKMYTWETPFSKILTDTRKKEVRKILYSSYVKACNITLILTQEKLVAFVTLTVYVYTGGSLTTFKVFILIAILGALRIAAGSAFLRSIERLSESISSTRRIQEFMLLDEIEYDSNQLHNVAESSAAYVEMSNFSASWDSRDPETQKCSQTLDNVTLKVNPGELVVLVGPVGAGKSSLLSAILGELTATSGKKVVHGTLTYAGQTPWIFSGTVRDNILFGESFHEARYKRVVSSCCLSKDLDLFRDGDLTLVGERGVTLSGGQKARLNLARAVYKSDASIFLFDDPLSAVDPPVARHIYTECISTFLKNKTRILVTHQLQLLEKADKILILKEGQVVGCGTYSELNDRETDFAALVKPTEREVKEVEKDSNQALTRSPTKFFRNRASQRSTVSAISYGTDILEENIIPVEMEEELEKGSIGFRAYKKYFLAGGNVVMLSLLVLLYATSNVLFIMNDWWSAQWAASYEVTESMNISISIPNSTMLMASTSPTIANENNQAVSYYVITYAALCLSVFFAMLLTVNLHIHICVSSGIKMHKDMLRAILKAPVRFFDTNPVGRVLNRFSKDMGQVDELLPIAFQDFLRNCTLVLSVVIMVAVINYLAVAIILPSVIYFLWLRKYYIRTSRSIKRLEGSCRSPVFSLLSSTLDGLVTIRGFKVESKFEKRFHEAQDLHSASWFLFLTGSRWFGLRLDMMSAIFLGSAALLCVIAISVLNIDAGQVGLILTQAASCNALFQWGVRQSAEVESFMTSVERIQQFNRIEPEAPHDIPETKPDSAWPQMGSIEFRNVYFAYYENGPNILQNINFKINAKEKIGLVGRTGAGKSSVISALFRLAELSDGEIYIDGIGISSIGLADLRSVISIIPQDPVLFSGTLRSNLDPFNNFCDSDLWNALTQVQLHEFVSSLPSRLDTEVTEAGSNVSVGQRQLICLARALLRRNRILLVDEATANVDLKTDSLIQETIRERFTECTVITIAHRINTIIDSDRIIVLDAGSVKEFDSPHQLLQRKGGFFRKIVDAMEPQEAMNIHSNVALE